MNQHSGNPPIAEGKSVLIIGGTGTLGRAVVERLLSGDWGRPSCITVMSRDESKQHDMRTTFLRRNTTTDEVIYGEAERLLQFQIGDVRSIRDLVRAVDGTDIVIYAAAMKQVPTCEYFPQQALLTNCLGAYNLVEAIAGGGWHVETVVGISTDKACLPINVMGMSKAIQERIFTAANLGSKSTRFVAVRYGNIVASRGSVVPLFLDQIRNGGPLTLTSPQMTRFLMNIGDAVDTIGEAIATARRGEVVMRAAPSATMAELARILVAERDVAISVIGIRPGEKLHETLISLEEASRTCRVGNYFFMAPLLPELKDNQDVDGEPLQVAYSSNDHVVCGNAVRQILEVGGITSLGTQSN